MCNSARIATPLLAKISASSDITSELAEKKNALIKCFASSAVKTEELKPMYGSSCRKLHCKKTSVTGEVWPIRDDSEHLYCEALGCKAFLVPPTTS